MLGPHVVGQRVVVRRVVRGETGPTGGPAMTDVLGTCESWADGLIVVRREDGSAVEIATADIVSGKPVPPRPSVRLRVSAREAEQHALVLWPRIEQVPLGEWVLRSDPAPVGRLLKRANSCLAYGDRPDDALDAITAFYDARGREALAQVSLGSETEEFFASEGWTPVAGGDAHFQTASLARALRRLGTPSGVAVTQDGHLLRASVGDVAVGEAALDGDWVGAHGLKVAPDRRRTGLGSQVLAALLERAAEHGATTAWLQVEIDNDAALAMYESLGFVTHHTNRYVRAPG